MARLAEQCFFNATPPRTEDGDMLMHGCTHPTTESTHHCHDRNAARSDRNSGRLLRFVFALAVVASIAGYAALLPGCAIFADSTQNAEPLTPIAKWYRAQATFNATLNTLSTLREDGQIDDHTYFIIDPLVNEATDTLAEMKRAADAGRDLEFDDHLRNFERLIRILKRYTGDESPPPPAAAAHGDTALLTSPAIRILAPELTHITSMEASLNHESGDTSTHLRRVTDRSGNDAVHPRSRAREQRDRRGHPAGTHPWTRGALALEGARAHFHNRAIAEWRDGQHAARTQRWVINTIFFEDAMPKVASPCRVATAQAHNCESSSTGERANRRDMIADHDRSPEHVK